MDVLLKRDLPGKYETRLGPGSYSRPLRGTIPAGTAIRVAMPAPQPAILRWVLAPIGDGKQVVWALGPDGPVWTVTLRDLFAALEGQPFWLLLLRGGWGRNLIVLSLLVLALILLK